MLTHLMLHLLVPLLVAGVFFRSNMKWAFLIMIATMVVDLDHLLATPIFDPDRCSIGVHPLHTLPAIFVYLVISFFPKLRYVGIGLLIHMMLDSLYCFQTKGIWFV